MSSLEYLAEIAATLPGLIYSLRLRPDGIASMPFVSAVRNLFGCEAEDVRNDISRILERTHPDDIGYVMESIHECARGMKPWRIEFRFFHPEKGEIWLGGHSSLPVREDDGSVLWNGYMHDITESKRTEQQMRLAASVFDIESEAVMVTDADAKILIVNEAFIQVTGYTREEIIGRTPALLQSGRHDGDFFREMWGTLADTGQWQGEIWNRRKNGDTCLEWLSINAVRDSHGRVVNYVGILRDAAVGKESQKRMEFLVTHDDLTSLPNRVLSNDRLRLALARAERHLTRLAVLIVDLDNFRGINDTLGHDLGDALLIQTAHRLLESVREEDSVARLGGDEFSVIVENADGDVADQTAERILANLSRGYWIRDNEYFVSSSIGISLFPDDATDLTALMRNADTAMYRAKAQGKNTYRFFSEDMGSKVKRHLTIENNLRKAIRNNELFVEFQPQVELVTSRLVGCEALVRWRRNGTSILPDEFIKVAEDSDLIVELDQWVVAEVCRQIAVWEKSGLSDFTVSINISGRHFRQLDMFHNITGIIQSFGILPERVCLEITEGALMDRGMAGLIIDDLREYGFRISLDDFGTGYSSLSYLKKFKIHELKIDKAFVDGILDEMDARSIILAIIGMAKSLGMMVVAEGVEEEDQHAMLMSYGCDIGQGYYYSHPISGPAFADWVVGQRVK